MRFTAPYQIFLIFIFYYIGSEKRRDLDSKSIEHAF